MKTKIHIVECEDTLKIIRDYQIKDGCINIRHYDDYDGEEGYYSEKVPVTILNTFSVITKGEFIRNENDFYYQMDYILQNPVKAKLTKNWEDWTFVYLNKKNHT